MYCSNNKTNSLLSYFLRFLDIIPIIPKGILLSVLNLFINRQKKEYYIL